MNIYLLFACMTVLPVLAGKGVLAILYRKQARKFYLAECLIVGWLVVIGLAEAAHLAAVFLGWSLSKVTGAFAIAGLVISCVGCIVWLISRRSVEKVKKTSPRELTPLRFGMILAFVLPVIWQIMTIVSQESVYRVGDMTAETVESFLEEDSIYAVNPLTGKPYEAGIPLRIKILGLPTLYAVLCNLFGVSSMELVWKYIPILVLILSYGAFGIIGRALFDREKDRDNCLLFMAFTALVFCAGDYALGMDGFGLLHGGFRGVTIRNMVLVPYAFSLALRRKWRPACAVVLAEACIAWTLYGMGMCLAVLAGMAAIGVFQNKKTAGLRSVKEEA